MQADKILEDFSRHSTFTVSELTEVEHTVEEILIPHNELEIFSRHQLFTIHDLLEVERPALAILIPHEEKYKTTDDERDSFVGKTSNTDNDSDNIQNSNRPNSGKKERSTADQRRKARERMRSIRKFETKEKKLKRRQIDKERKRFTRLQKKLVGSIYEDQPNKGMDDLQIQFDSFLKSLTQYTCSICNKRQIISKFVDKPCQDCDVYSAENDLDPGEVPPELQNLTVSEQMLISPIFPVVLLYKIRNSDYYYTGNVISFPQNIQEVATELPHKVSDLKGLIAIRTAGSDGHQDFHVRKKVVLDAIHCLKKINPYFKNMKISCENSDSLPEEGNIYNDVRGYNVKESEPKSSQENDDGSKGIEYQDIPNVNTSENEKLNNNLDDNVLMWPSLGSIPVNEFSSPGYISMAFPYLFPYGKCDYSTRKNKDIKFPEYVKHLMLYKDERFAKDPRFRFFLLNSQLRWDSLNLGTTFVKKNSVFSNMTLIQLKAYLKEHPEAIKYIMFYSSRLRSTKAFWMSKSSELSDMVERLGPATIFFTLSFPDLYSKDLFRLLGHEDISKLSMHQRHQIITDNPLIASTFFKLKSEYFIEHSMKCQFDIIDSWYRVEFQSRGAPHIHGLIWLKDAPSVKGINDNEAKKEEVKSYFDKLIFCMNPDLNLQQNFQHPCEKNLSDVTDMKADLAELVNTVQRHTRHSENYCWKKKGKKQTGSCRFGFPKPLAEVTSVKDRNGYFELEFKRNDQLVNKYNEWVLQTWRGNMDFSPIDSERVLYKYISKYASKCEYKSNTYKGLIDTVQQSSLPEDEHCKRIIRKLLIHTISERDYCAQEVMYLLMRFKLYHSSRTFVVLNLRNQNWEMYNRTGSSNTLSFFQHYAMRPDHLSTMNIISLAEMYYVKKRRWVKRRKSVIVRTFPRIRANSALVYDDVRNQCIFYVPWTNLSQFDVSLDDLKEMLTKTSFNCQRFDYEDDDIILEWFSDSSEGDSDDNEKNNGTHVIENKGDKIYTAISNIARGQHKNQTENIQFGLRPIDTDFDWCNGLSKYNYDNVDKLNNKIKSHSPNHIQNKVDYNTLQSDQLLIFNFFCQQLENLQKAQLVKHPFVVVQAKAGYGKSYLLKAMVQKCYETFGPESSISLGPTGVSARSVSGLTIHSWSKIPKIHIFFKNLEGENLKIFQTNCKSLKCLFVDEYSMIGCRLLAMLEQRCREAKDCNDLFGNLIVYFFGDIFQIAPVGDLPVFVTLENNNYSSLTQRGKVIISAVDKAFTLNIPKRFTDMSYCKFLDRLAEGNCIECDVDMLNTRFYQNIDKMEITKFKESVRLATLNNDVKEYNNDKLAKLQKPVARIFAENNSKLAFNTKDDVANSLSNILYLSVGCKVMLRCNINVQWGLVNGAIGEVFDILYAKSTKPPKLPAFVLVKFQGIDGFTELNGTVPIKPFQSSWFIDGKHCTRIQVPLTLCWSTTVHKSQSLTLPSIQVKLGQKEFQIGCTYVALSRVSKLSDLLLLETVDLDRLNLVKEHAYFHQRKSFIENQLKLPTE